MNPQTERALIDTIVAQKHARALDDRALQTLFLHARTARGFIAAPVPREVLERIVELAELGPTQSNTLPLRLIFVQTPQAKERLRPLLSRGNVDKTMAAPVTAIVGADVYDFARVPRASSVAPTTASAKPADTDAAIRAALMNAAMQGAYLIVAARALGLDVGPMAGFDRDATDTEFFPDGRVKSLWLANIGYADDTKTPPRAARYAFEEIAQVL